MAAQHVDHRRAAALERHHHRVDAGHHGEQHRRGMRKAANAGVREMQRAGLCLGQRDQLLHGGCLHGGMHREHARPISQRGGECERLRDVVVELVDVRIDRVRQRDQHERMAIRGRRVRKLEPDHAAGAGAVLSRHLLAQPVAELLCGEPRHDVDAAAGRERDDQPQRLRWILLRRGGRGECDEQGKGFQQDRAHLRFPPSLLFSASSECTKHRVSLPSFQPCEIAPWCGVRGTSSGAPAGARQLAQGTARP